MTKRNIFIAVIALVICAGGFYYRSVKQKADDMLQVEAVAFSVNGGWGYKVVVDGRTYIYQDVIPGIQGNQVFKSQEDALKVGQRVVYKLVHHQLPAITEQELIAMQINDIK
ncbi:DUF4907 domain-containing protein [Chitinophaga silvatica]|nr:DUF4907 domain-containing protein [Chitinophaga silvatica]